MKIKVVELKNKSRKGLYIYMKAENKPARYYRYTENENELKRIKDYYNSKYVKKRTKKTIKTYKKRAVKIKKQSILKQPSRYLQKVRKKGGIDKQLKIGMADVVLANVHNAPYNVIELKKKELMKKVIIDSEIVDIMAQNENLKKIKHRFEYRIRIYDGDILAAELNKTNISPDDLIAEMRDITKRGEEIGSGWKQKMERNKYNVNTFIEGKHVGQTDVHIIFRRGK